MPRTSPTTSSTPGLGEQAAGVLRELAAHQHRDLRIELDGLDAAGTVLARAKDLETAASTDDEHGSEARRPGRRGRRCCHGGTRGAIGSSVAAVIASMASPSVKSPSCGGGSFAAIRLKPGAWRNGTRGLSITSIRPSGLERVSIIRVAGTRSAWLRALYSPGSARNQ